MFNKDTSTKWDIVSFGLDFGIHVHLTLTNCEKYYENSCIPILHNDNIRKDETWYHIRNGKKLLWVYDTI